LLYQMFVKSYLISIWLDTDLTVQLLETKSVGMWNIWRQQRPAVWQRKALPM
jgi:pseudouridine-5'-phosphate glycosidase